VLRALLLVALAALASGCSTLLSPEPTPVPGAAATLTRSSRTPIPTPERVGSPSPAVSPAPSRVAASPSPSASASPVALRPATTDDDAAEIQRRFMQIFADPLMPGMAELLLDHVSLSTKQGGSVLTNTQAVSWLTDHASTSVTVAQTDTGTQSVMLQVVTEGWPNADPIDQGRVTFTLRRYDQSGKPDEENGDWKVDVIDAE
jgi:hypothetical protein